MVLTRLAVHRLDVPLAAAAPVVWVGLEYLRTHLMTGFGWYLMAHSQFDFTTLIQISDLGGAYGVSFVLLVASAALAECIPARWFSGLRLLPPMCDVEAAVRSASSRRRVISVLSSILLTAASVLYGIYRGDHAEFPTGPRVGIAQGDFRSDVKHDPNEAEAIYERHVRLTGMLVDYRPDVIVWPETMVPYRAAASGPRADPRSCSTSSPRFARRSGRTRRQTSPASCAIRRRWPGRA